METQTASKEASKGWPKTPDGVTDWEYVFEAPDTGIIDVVSQAQSSAALNDCAVVIISNLFTRKDDRPEVARYMSLLRPVIEDAERTKDIDVARDHVVHLLRQIKTERVHKAQTYVRQKRRKQAIERRGKAALATAPQKTRRTVMAAGGVIAIVIGGLVYWLMGDAPDTSGQSPEAKWPAEPEPSATARNKENRKSVRKHARGQPQRPPTSSEATLTYPQSVLLTPVVWGIKTTRGDTRYVAYQPFLEINDEAAFEKICANQPWVTDAIFSNLDRGHPKERRASRDELAKISSAAMRRINDRYGHNTLSGIVLVNKSNRRFQDAVRGCQFEFGMPE